MDDGTIDPGVVDDLEALFTEISDEEAARLVIRQANRLKRARSGPGSAVDREQLGEIAYEVVSHMAVLILEETVKVKTVGQATAVATAFHQIARLEAGKSTQTVETMTRPEREAIAAELAAKAAESVAQQEGLRLVENQ